MFIITCTVVANKFILKKKKFVRGKYTLILWFHLTREYKIEWLFFIASGPIVLYLYKIIYKNKKKNYSSSKNVPHIFSIVPSKLCSFCSTSKHVPIFQHISTIFIIRKISTFLLNMYQNSTKVTPNEFYLTIENKLDTC